MSARSAIAGCGRTAFEQAQNRNVVELVLEAVDAALAEAGLTRADLDYIVTASVDLWDGRTASNVSITEVVGAVMRAETRVAADGLTALLHADLVIRSGKHDTVLVVAHCTESECDHQALSNWTFDPVYLQPLGLDYHAMELLQNDVRGISGEPRPARTACDGAAAVVLRTAGPATDRAPLIVGTAQLTDVHYPGRRNLARGVFPETTKRAVRAAGLNDLGSVGYAALAAESERDPVYHETLQTLNFSGELLPSGSAPFLVAGLSRFIDARLALVSAGRGVGALVQAAGGAAAQNECVVILEAGNAA